MGALQQMLAATGVGAAAASYTTWNPLDKGLNITLSGGNLTVDTPSSFHQMVRSIAGKSSGKWYYEFTPSTANFHVVGVENGTQSKNAGLESAPQGISYYPSGGIYKNGVSIATYASYTTGDVIGVAFDAGTGNVTFYKNNTLQGTPGSITWPMFAAYGNFTSAATTGTANFGATAQVYSPPSGYTAGVWANDPITFVASSTGTTSATKPTGTAAGDMILIFGTGNTSGTYTPPSGFTDLFGGPGNQGACYKVAGASEPASYNYSNGASFNDMVILVFRNVSSIDVIGSFNAVASVTSIAAPAVTTTYATDMLVAAFGSIAGVTFNGISGMTQVDNTSNPPISAYYQQLSASGTTGTRTVTTSGGASDLGCGMLALR
jgi:hypothetical protein